MNTQGVIESASLHLHELPGHVFDVLTVERPTSIEQATHLVKVISKLSPLVGNLIEFSTVEFLNEQAEYAPLGQWIRQDPGFPDAIFEGSVSPRPGFEIKAWFPLATEITARFKDSRTHFAEDQTYVCLLAWLPEFLFFGKPRVIDVCVVSGRSVAEARDRHYHKPPDYLVIEPEDTSARTANLQQTNTNGFKFQGTAKELAEASDLVNSWGTDGRVYQAGPEYQNLLRELQSSYSYRLDTNFAKMDRIEHGEIEEFKQRVLGQQMHGRPIKEWPQLLTRGSEASRRNAIGKVLGLS